MSQQSNILLEAGTNELEVLVCTIAGTRYGVNVAKVREVIRSVKTTRIPRAHRALLGTFMLRDSVISLIDLYCYFGIKREPPAYENRNIIVMEFNNLRVGFLVDTLDRIYRVSWSNVSPAPVVEGNSDSSITSICKIDEQVVLMIDFETIVFDISGTDLFKAAGKCTDERRPRPDIKILHAEDSATMRKLIAANIVSSGYTSITAVEDGESAWQLLQKQASTPGATQFDILITDIEMPRLDGLALTKRVKEHATLKNVPVVVFSSLVSPDNLKKIQAVNADAQITKPELGRLVDLIDSLTGGWAALSEDIEAPTETACAAAQ